VGPDAHRSTPFRGSVDEGRGNFAHIRRSQGPPAQPAASGDGDTVGEAAVSLDDAQQPRVAPTLREVQLEQLGGVQSHADPQHLPRAQPRMQRGNLAQARVQRDHE
jgi:hypothetical protein